MKDEPIYPKYETKTDVNNTQHQTPVGGMTLRDTFAAYALSGALASTSQADAIMLEKLAKFCFAVADAMLEARGAE